ncbi:putative ABC transporter type 1, transmembrane domain superfamily [Helianthus anomalus]
MFTALDRNTMIYPEGHDGKKLEIITGHVEICLVHLAYPARPDMIICNGFSINCYGLKSGSGKSTIS